MSSSQQPPRPLSHLSPIPITQQGLHASYDNDNKQLILRAQGNAIHITTGIEFKRIQQFVGGLLFEVQGWVGPVTHGIQPYDIENTFNIDLPNRVTPSGFVIIKGAEGAEYKVKIQPLLKDGSSGNNNNAASNVTASSEAPKFKLIPPTEPIITQLGKPITVLQSDQFSGKGGSVDITFDDRFLKLTNARVTDNQIEWTFDPLQTGDTEVDVYVSQHLPPFTYRVVHNVIINPPSNTKPLNALALFSVNQASKAVNDTTESDIAKSGDKNSNIVLISWDDIVTAGLDIIKKQYPDAQLLTAEGSAPGAQSPYQLANVRLSARVDGNKTATIHSLGYYDFGPVETGPLRLGVTPFNWPVKINSNDAFSILRKDGYKQPVERLVLSQPVIRDLDQPLYTFIVGNLNVQIGAIDGKIHSPIRS
ncbi:uncharacterized protein CCOS01_05727 [Colletotrichum costaricense]|uniref:Uncharacterized protein n=1 Tax=Colletotrichum costaricense TaxID=1209916 RepID=A0AAJ0E3G0_9PEZI|nr:uncharacterized protein CCOS01_05727 [Colletotrichum costaricense]KAK1530624.1 hypothetical protein CCOS01_05727 [Colletotrichum costaricense]